MLRHVALVGTDVSEEHSTSIINMTRIGELGTMLAVLATNAHCEEMPLVRTDVSEEHSASIIVVI
jgi:hypothetical protein